MKKTFVIHPIKLAVSIATAVITLVLSISAIRMDRWVQGIIFAVISAVFFALTPIFGSTVTLSAEGVRRRFLGFLTRSLTWDEILEVGVAGTKVLKKAGSDRTGEMYIYFSPYRLDDQTRFEMMLKWPPRDQLYMLYTHNRLKYVSIHADRRIEKYNVGKLRIDNKSMK